MTNSPSLGRRAPFHFTGRDWIATALIGAVVVVYAGYLVVGSVWFIDTVPEMAIVGLIGGFLSRLIGGRADFSPRWPAAVAAITTLALGIFALISGSGVLLAVFIAANVVVFVAGLVAWARISRSPVGDRRSAEVLR
jgi:hypothetical protein